MQRLRGIAAAGGIAIGVAHVIDRRKVKTPHYHIAPEEVEDEVVRLREAIEATDRQLARIKEKLTAAGGETLILDAHQLILKDEYLVGRSVENIRQRRINAEWALSLAVGEVKAAFDRLGDDYFRERRSDVDFVASHLQSTLMGHSPESPALPPDPIIVAHDLSPADTARLHRFRIRAFATDVGGPTSHTAIMARSLRLPAVVGLKEATASVGEGDAIIVDGYRGEIIICPDEVTVRRYEEEQRSRQRVAVRLRRQQKLPAETRDGLRITLLANIEIPEEIPIAVENGAEGIGLYRTEFLFLGRDDLPSEEDHYQDALQVITACDGLPVTVRTCDLGSDKITPLAGVSDENNPAMGLRSTRLMLQRRDIFRTQLRGLLRAAQEHPLRIMFPMISGLEELRQARAVLDGCLEEVAARGPRPRVPVGVMVEMPAAAMTADMLAEASDFLSIGTNDLIQYALGIDRLNEQVSYLYHPLHPAILRLIRRVVRAGRMADVPVSVCGEMSGDPALALVLMGLGVEVLSMNAGALPQVKRAIRAASAEEMRALAATLLDLPTVAAIEAEVRAAMEALFPGEGMGPPATAA